LEPAAFAETEDGELVEAAVGVGVTRRVELTVERLPDPVPVATGAVTITVGVVIQVVFE
jgi:hypothetical protein